MNTQKLTITKEKMFEKFVDDWVKGQQHILAASKLYVKALDEKLVEREWFYEKAKGLVARRTLRIAEAIGRGLMNHRVLSAGKHAAKIRKLPYDLQTKVLDGCMFEFLTADGSHKMECPRDCEDLVARQMFAVDHIRNLAEQKAWIEAEKVKLKIADVEHVVPYEIKKKGILVTKPNTFITTEELKRLVLELL